MTTFEIVNEDGTPLDFERPKNPLEEKWERLYPPTPMPQYSQVCDGYSCMWCGRCPRGDNWKVPEEDKEIWEDYRRQCREYNRIHNPRLYEMLNKFDKED